MNFIVSEFIPKHVGIKFYQIIIKNLKTLINIINFLDQYILDKVKDQLYSNLDFSYLSKYYLIKI